MRKPRPREGQKCPPRAPQECHQSWVRGEKSEAVSPKTGPNSDHSVRHSGQDIEEIFSGPGHEALRQQYPRGAYTASRTLYPDREAGGERGQ